MTVVCFPGTIAVDVAEYLPADTLSGIVYVCSFLSVKQISDVSTPLADRHVESLIAPGAATEAVYESLLGFSDGMFELRSEYESASKADLLSRKKERWNVQSAWLGYAVHQTSAHRLFSSTRDQNTDPLLALGANGLPVLIMHGADDVLMDAKMATEGLKNNFKNSQVVLFKGASHALHLDDKEKVMDNISEFVKYTREGRSRRCSL